MLSRVIWIGLLVELAVSIGEAGEERVWLVREGRACCRIVCGRGDDYAGERLGRWVKEESGATAEVLAAGDRGPSGEECVVLLGTVGSNPLIGRIASKVGIDPDPTKLTDQGYVAKSGRVDGREWVIVAGGGRDGVIHGVADLMNVHLNRDGKGVWVGKLDSRQVPRFRYRWLWTWDNRMDWGGAGETVATTGGGQYRMGGNLYKKSAEGFLTDYKRCIDYMADHKFNGLIIWGFLRDEHGGVEAGRDLCRYANVRGVRILPGVGTSGYAGYYYGGKHQYNIPTWVAEHPELRMVNHEGQAVGGLCPSKKANQEWLDRGAKWLFETFEIGGVNLEMGDRHVCYCDECKRARAAIPSKEPEYYKDMAISHRVTLAMMRRLAPNAWLSYATYTGFDGEMMKTPPKFLTMIPEDAICQWTLSHMATDWPAGVRPMARHNLGYLHWCNTSTKTQDDFFLGEVREICRRASETGFEGLTTYGEVSADPANAEVFYLAWEAFLWDPDMTVDQFVDQRVSRLYGGSQAGRKLLEILPLVRTSKERANPENLVRARRLAESGRATASADARERWGRMIAYLDRQQNRIR